ncbi:hypothetical protein LCGC14_2292180, partial [marine sediment metagenome]
EEDLLKEAQDRFRASSMFEDNNRIEGLDDLQFKLGGRLQWPDDIVRQREAEHRPMLTINKLPVFTDQVIGDSRQNKISIRVRPTGKEASEEIAKILNGLIRNIEKESDSDSVYQWGLQGAVDSGRGCWRVVKEFEDDNVFEQVLRLRRISNAYSVYFDGKAEDPTYKDGRYCFVTELVGKDEYEERWPDKNPSDWSGLGLGDDLKYWFENDQRRVAEYWVKMPKKRRLYLLSDGRVVDGDKWDSIVDELEAKEKAFHVTADGEILEGPATGDEKEVTLNEVPEIKKERSIDSHEIVQYILDGAQILEGPTPWEGKYIPIVPVWGKEINIEGKRYYRGLIRNAKDPQRMYNWERTEEVERNALARKAPLRMTPEQIEGHEWMYNSDEPRKYQLYNFIQKQPPPQDVLPPQASTGNVNQSATANDEIKATTGLNQPNLGLASGAGSSGIKEQVLQRKGDVGTFEFHDNQARAIKFTGEILVDLIPLIYDNERTITILGEDDSESVETINQVQSLNPKLKIEGILRTMYDPRNSLTTDVSSQLAEYFGDSLYRTCIPRNVRLAEAPSYGQPALIYDRQSKGAVA